MEKDEIDQQHMAGFNPMGREESSHRLSGQISLVRPHHCQWSAFAQSQNQKVVKGMLAGPVTILNWSFPREDVSTKESTLQLALAIQEEVLGLEKNGIRMIQIDEAALGEKLPLRQSDWCFEYLDWAIPAFRLVHSKVKPETQIHTHMKHYVPILLFWMNWFVDTLKQHSVRVFMISILLVSLQLKS